MSKARITLYLDGDRWRTFRAACVGRGRSASGVVESLVAEQLRAWAAESDQNAPTSTATSRADDDPAHGAHQDAEPTN